MPALVYKDPNLKVPRFGRTQVPQIVRPFKYKLSRTPAQITPVPSLPEVHAEELLIGFVHGKRASDLEERFARALDEARLQFIFQYPLYGAYQIPGEENKIDFMVFDGPVLIPVEPRGGFVHESPSKKALDGRRTQILNEALARQGIRKITQLDFDEPRDMDEARQLVRDLFARA